jgi:hypothetical protein
MGRSAGLAHKSAPGGCCKSLVPLPQTPPQHTYAAGGMRTRQSWLSQSSLRHKARQARITHVICCWPVWLTS